MIAALDSEIAEKFDELLRKVIETTLIVERLQSLRDHRIELYGDSGITSVSLTHPTRGLLDRLQEFYQQANQATSPGVSDSSDSL